MSTDTTCANVLQAVQATFARNLRREAKIDKAQVEIDEIERSINELQRRLASKRVDVAALQADINKHSPLLDGRFLAPLTEALMPFFPGAEVKIYGPAGLGATFSVYFVDPTKPQEEDIVGCLQFRRQNSRLCYVDHSVDTGRFGPNSVGALNGLNHPEVEITDEMPLSDLVALFKRSVAQ